MRFDSSLLSYVFWVPWGSGVEGEWKEFVGWISLISPDSKLESAIHDTGVV
jgi:hypothetical protein